MEKSFILQMDLDEDKIMSPSNASYEGFVTRERSKYLLSHLDNIIQSSLESGEEINVGAEFLRFLEEEELTGNDVAFLMFTGYCMSASMTALRLRMLNA